MRHALVVHGDDGLDELTTTDTTEVVRIRDGEVDRFQVTPESVGLARVSLDDIAVGDPAQNAAIATAVLEGRPGPLRDIVLLNAAAALVVADVADDLADGLHRAAAAVDGGDAARTLGELVAVTRALTSADD